MSNKMAVSIKPWSTYTEADYTFEQWKAACLIDQSNGNATSKSQFKLPIKTPNGVVNKNGVMAAAGALAGARGGVDASAEEKTKAAKKLTSLYRKMEMDPPMSLVKMAGMMHSEEVSAFLAHAVTGNTTAIIAAIPAAMDSVRLIGDEDKHATLFFFGETSTLPADAKTTLTSTLEQVSRMISPFREGVRDITRLGSDNPPALVAMLTNRNLGRIRDIMQVNPAIKGYLSNATQYPSFTPHVTLGYPDYQGETELRDLAKGLYGIKFDKLALWWNDERIEFDLNDMLAVGESEDSMAMADDLVADFLAHHGVIGMKWGVRKDSFGIGSINLVTGKQTGNPVARGAVGSNPALSKQTISDVNLVFGSLHKHLASPAAANSYRAKVYKSYISKAKQIGSFDKQVYREHASKALSEVMKEHLKKEGVRGVEIKTFSLGKPDEFHYVLGDKKTVDSVLGDLKVTKIAHADALQGAVRFKVTLLWNADGTPNGYSVGSSELVHSDDLVENFLAHHGIRGMKWGIRRANPSGGVDLSGVSRKDARSMKKDAAGTIRAHKTSDGKTILVQKQKDGSWKETHLSPDQQRLHEALGKPLHELSNQEVRDVVERQRLINSYNEMFAPKNNPQQGQGKSELQLKVEHLELQKRYADAQRALTPPKKDRVQSFTKKVSTGWRAFNAIDKTLNHNLSKGISRRLGLEPPLTTVQKLKAQNELLSLRKKNIKDTVEIVELSKLHTNLLDAPSLAPKYSTPGKRRKHTGEPIFNLP